MSSAHRVFERLEIRNRARQRAFVVALVIALGEVHDAAAGFEEKLLAVGVCGDERAVPGQRQAQRFGQAVHGIRREHARARPACGAAFALIGHRFLVADVLVRALDHGVDQVHRDGLALQRDLACLHRAAGDEDRRNVEPQRRHQHAGRDLVAIGDAHERVGAVGVGHVFDRVGDQLAARQRIEHAAMAHRDAVIDGDGVEFLGDAPCPLDLAGHKLAEVLQMHMPRHELRKRIGDGDDRLAEILILHAGRAPKSAGACHVAAMGGGS